MSGRGCLGVLLLGVVATLAGCGNPQGLDSIAVSPTGQSLTVGQTLQFTATGTYGNANHSSTQNITGVVTWSSSSPSVATVNSSGLATAVGAGTTTITASAAGYAGPVSSSAIVTVTGSTGGVAGGSVVSIAIIPGSQSVSAPGQTGQFLAIGTTSSGATVNLAGQVVWSSSSTAIATIGAASGLATAVGQGSTTITAIYSNTAGGTVVTGTATFTVSGGTTEKYTAVSITPNAQSLSASGQTGQFVALATSGTTGLQSDVTNSSQIRWLSSAPSIATVSAAGLAAGVSAGNTTITAELTNPDGTVVSGTASVAVSATQAPEPLLSLQIIPNSITVGNLQDTGQFLAIGTFSSAPYVRDLTNSVAWLTAAPSVFPVTTNCNPSSSSPSGSTTIQCAALSAGSQNGGVVTAFGVGTATIIAEAESSDGTIQTATASFTCPAPGNPPQGGQCYQGSQADALLSTLTIYNEGLNTANWLVTAPSATGTPNVIHCGPGWAANGNSGGSVCTATYPVTATQGITILITAPAQAGVNFGGWSYNCTPSDSKGNALTSAPYFTEAGPNYCTVTFSPPNAIGVLNSNVTVGAIFD